MNKVSVIVPAYNAARFIGPTIESVQSQSWKNWELIIINDGSTDSTRDAIQPYLSDKRIIYIEQPNAGCSAAKNTGLKYATGEWIQYLDADDLLSSNKLEAQVKVLEGNPWHIAVCKTELFAREIGDNGAEIDTDFLYNTNDTFEFILNLYGINGKDGMIQPNAFLISKRLAVAAGRWDLSISPAPDEDGEYFCRMMLKANRIHFTEGINYYRKDVSDKASLSKQISELHAKGGLRSLELKAQHLLDIENSFRVKKLVAKHYASFMYQYINKYPQLAREAEKKIKELQIKRIPAVGGRNFRLMARLLGFRNAHFLKQIVLGQ